MDFSPNKTISAKDKKAASFTSSAEPGSSNKENHNC